MSNTVFTNVFRFLALLALQVLILKRINLLGEESMNYINFLVYPLFILLLPFSMSSTVILLLAFLMGISVDYFYDSLGVHASALVFLAWSRGIVLRQLEPKGGYNLNYSPTKKRMGTSWFFRYTIILMGLFVFFYFCVEVFNFALFGRILLKSILSYIASVVFIIILMFIFDPTD